MHKYLIVSGSTDTYVSNSIRICLCTVLLIISSFVTLSISGTGSLLVSHVDRLVSDDLTSMLHKLGTNGKLELHIIGAFADSMGISETLLVPILGNLHYLSLIM